MEELEDMRAATDRFISRRLKAWAVRWCIGFAVIWAVVAIWPDLFWLWLVGVSIAVLSLVILLFVEWLLKRQLTNKINRMM